MNYRFRVWCLYRLMDLNGWCMGIFLLLQVGSLGTPYTWCWLALVLSCWCYHDHLKHRMQAVWDQYAETMP